jgi:hypothetical protein
MRRRSFLLIVLTLLLPPGWQPAQAAVCDGSLSQPVQPTFKHGGVVDVGASPEAGSWAVGTKDVFGDVITQYAVAEHFDGSTWVRMSLPRTTGFGPKSVAVTGPVVWVAGRRSKLKSGGDAGSMIERWDGVSWQIEDLPSIASATSSVMWAIDGAAQDDVWAAGRTVVNGAFRMLILHWDGASWTRVRAPLPWAQDPNLDITVTSVSAGAANDVWIVGRGYPHGEQSFAMHWDGSVWTVHNPTVADSPLDNTLDAVDGAGSAVWAVGSAGGAPLVIRWTGTAWKRIASPDTGYATNQLSSVAVGSSVLIGGSGYNGFPPSPNPIYQRWSSGSGWTALASPASLGSLDLAASGQILATGNEGLGSPMLILEGCLA